MKDQKRTSLVVLTLFFLCLLPDELRGQDLAPGTEVEILRSEIERIKAHQETQISTLQETLIKLEGAQGPRLVPAAASAPAFKAQEGEKEITLPAGPEIQTERRSLLEAAGLPRADIAGTRISGFLVGSFSYNSHIQLVPEFAGGAPALADARETNFRFDKFGFGLSKTFAPWLSASAAVEVESHRDRHSHGFDQPPGSDPSGFGCTSASPGQPCIERFGTEEAETEVVLDKFAVTAVTPIGNGLSLSLGRFDVPFGIERHDEPLLLTATTSELFRFGRPNKMTGFLTSYPFAPWLDISAWAVNRWEAETTHDDFNDNNKGKSFGGRIGFTPFPREGLLNFGLGGFFGPEQDENRSRDRWVIDVDFTWNPLRRFLVSGEFAYGGEDKVSFRERGLPFPAPAVDDKDVNWWGFYFLGHYDLYDWLGLSLRYGFFDDMDAWRTGVEQKLQSWTFAPIIHLSRLIPELRPMGATYVRTRHPLDWLDLKLEYRLNHSNKKVFSSIGPEEDILNADKTSHQLQAQLVVNF